MLSFTVIWYINPIPNKHKCLTNFSLDSFALYNTAVEIYNDKYKRYDVFIDREAYWKNGIYDPSMYALRVLSEHGNYSEFWEIFDRLNQTWGHNA